MGEFRSATFMALNGANFPTWKIQCRMALMKQGIWRIVDGKEIAPDDEVASRKFNDRKDRALATIVLAVDPSLLYLLGDPQDPVIVWKKLCDQFQKKTWANKLTLRRKLYGLKLRDNEPVQDHIKSMVEIFEELAIIGDAVEEEDRVVHILASLPDSYSMLVTALEACTEVPQLEVVTERLLHEERKMKERSAQYLGAGENAFFSNGSSSGSKRNGPVCFHCGKTGHIKRNCEDFKKQQNEKQSKESANFSYHRERKLSDSSSDDDFESCIALLVVSDDLLSATSEKDKNRWIVDSAASSHMCNDVNKFQNLKALKQVQKVKVGNGCFVEAKLEGTVKIDIETSNKITKCKLRNVLYVPDLKFNLLSVSQAAKVGKRVEFDEYGCRFIDIASNDTIATARKRGSLYYVNCRTKLDGIRYVKNEVQAVQMKKALLHLKENNFERDFMRRLNTIDIKKNQVDVQNQEDDNIEANEKCKIKEEVCYEDQDNIMNGDTVMVDGILKGNQEDSKEKEYHEENIRNKEIEHEVFRLSVDDKKKVRNRFRNKISAFKKLCSSKFGRK